jgi:hypothetical protein
VTQLADIRDPALYHLPKHGHARARSRELDRIIGFKIPRLEQKLLQKYQAYDQPSDPTDRKRHYEGTQAWIGLNPQVLQTPYAEMAAFLPILAQYDPKTIIDLGAGYGRLGIVMSAFLPQAQFIGYEIIASRFNEAQRIFELYDLAQCEMRKENIIAQDFELPSACVYFVYDFSDPLDLRVILNQLEERRLTERFFIVARGEGVRSLIQHKYPGFHRCFDAYHAPQWSLYSTFCDVVVNQRNESL